VTDTRVDARAGRVSAGAGSWPFALDCRTGGATMELGGAEIEVRPLRWREKVRLARFAILGLPFLDEQVLRLALPAESATPEGDEREAALALALWLNDPGDADPLPLQAPLLATATLEVCAAMGVAPSALDDRDAVEVEALWRAVAEHAAGPGPAALPGPAAAIESVPAFGRSSGGGTVEVGETRRIVFVPDQPAASEEVKVEAEAAEEVEEEAAPPTAAPPETVGALEASEQPAPAAGPGVPEPKIAAPKVAAPNVAAPKVDAPPPRNAASAGDVEPEPPAWAEGTDMREDGAPAGPAVSPAAADEAEPVPISAAPRTDTAPAPVGEAALSPARGEPPPSSIPTPSLPPTPDDRRPVGKPVKEEAVTPAETVFQGPGRAELSSVLLRRAPSVPAPVASRPPVPRLAGPATPAAAAPLPSAEAPVPARPPAPARPAAEARSPAPVAHTAAFDTDELFDELSERFARAAAELGTAG
jgi:hypothetical protein